MKNPEIYISIYIVHRPNGTSHCEMTQSVDNGPLEAVTLEENHAKKLMWELVKAGGVRDYHSNWYDPAISVAEAYIFLH